MTFIGLLLELIIKRQERLERTIVSALDDATTRIIAAVDNAVAQIEAAVASQANVAANVDAINTAAGKLEAATTPPA